MPLVENIVIAICWLVFLFKHICFIYIQQTLVNSQTSEIHNAVSRFLSTSAFFGVFKVVHHTNVENVRAFPSNSGQTRQQPPAPVLPPKTPAGLVKTLAAVPSRSLFSSDTDEDDLFGIRPPPIQSKKISCFVDEN